MIIFDHVKLSNYFAQTQRYWPAYLAAAIAGLLLPLGFAPFELRLLSFISPAVLFILLAVLPANKAFKAGYIYGLAAFGFGISWVFNSLVEFGGASILIALVLTAALTMMAALYFAVMAWASVKFLRGQAFSLMFLLIMLPLAWYLMEIFRSWFLTGFPWLLLGYSQTDTYLAGYMPVIGVTATAIPMCMISGAIATAFIARESQRLVGMGAGLAAFVIGVLLYPIEWSEPLGQSIRVSIVQASVPQKIKMDPARVDFSLEKYANLTQSVQGSDIIIWPETAIPDFQLRQDAYIQDIKQNVLRNNKALISGIFNYDLAQKKSYNSLMLISNEAEEQFYFKQRLVPFGEYLPFRNFINLFSSWVNMPVADLYPAEDIQQPFEFDGYHVGANICYESAYSYIFKQQLPNANFFMNVSNDAWFGTSLAPYQHLEMLKSRAIETGRFIARSTNTGISAFIDDRGKVMQSIGLHEIGVISQTISLRKGSRPYVVLANVALIFSIAILLLRTYLLRKINGREEKV